MIWALLSERLGVAFWEFGRCLAPRLAHTSHPVWPSLPEIFRKVRALLSERLGVTPQYPVTVTVTSSQKWSPKRNRHQAPRPTATNTPRSTGSNRARFALRSEVTP